MVPQPLGPQRAVADASANPDPGPVHGDMDFAPNTNVIGHAGRTFAIVEAGSRPYELTDELDTVGPCDFDGTLEGGYTAHPKRDPRTGELHAVSLLLGLGTRSSTSVIGADGRVRASRFIEPHRQPDAPRLSLTERYAVVYDLPGTFDLDAAMAGTDVPVLLARRLPARASGSCRATATAATCSGSRSTPATCSTR